MGDARVSTAGSGERPSLSKRVRLPRLSGKASAAWLVICFGVTALLIPLVLRLPRWVEFEIILAAWWGIWLAVLTGLLYLGQRVTDDHQLGQPRLWFASDPVRRPQQHRDPASAWWDGFFWGWMWDDAILIIIGLCVLVGVIWFLVEIAIPVLLFLLYFVTRGMLARVVNDRHRCRGRFGRALAWGLVGAIVYTAPLAGAVWFIHYAHPRSQAGL